MEMEIQNTNGNTKSDDGNTPRSIFFAAVEIKIEIRNTGGNMKSIIWAGW